MDTGKALIVAALAVVLEREGGELAFTQSDHAPVRAKNGDYIITTEIDKSGPGEPIIRVTIEPNRRDDACSLDGRDRGLAMSAVRGHRPRAVQTPQAIQAPATASFA